MKRMRDHQIQSVAEQIFTALKDSGVESRDIVRIISQLTSELTDDITGQRVVQLAEEATEVIAFELSA